MDEKKKLSKLRVWCIHQRFNKKNLCNKKLDLLSELGFEWCPYELKWNRHIADIIEYQKKYGDITDKLGNILLPKKKERSLYGFIINVRSNHSKGILPLNKLNQLKGPNITLLNPDKWMIRFEKYKQLKTKEQLTQDEKLWIKTWVSQQKQYINRKKLSKYKINLLNEIGFVFGCSYEEKWMEVFVLMLEKQNKKMDRLTRIKICDWKTRQRKLFRKGKLSSNRIKLLEEISFNFVAEK